MKSEIRGVDSALLKIMRLHGVTYKQHHLTKDSASSKPKKAATLVHGGKRQLGLVAQEVEKVVPEVVKTMPNGTKAIAYQNLVGLLVEGMKQQQGMIFQQEARLDSMERKMAACGCAADSSNGSMFKANHSKGRLYQNKPNPFSSETEIAYQLPDDAKGASIFIFDMQGSLKKSFALDASSSTGKVKMAANGLTPGMYLYSLWVDGNETDTKRMLIIQ